MLLITSKKSRPGMLLIVRFLFLDAISESCGRYIF